MMKGALRAAIRSLTDEAEAIVTWLDPTGSCDTVVIGPELLDLLEAVAVEPGEDNIHNRMRRINQCALALGRKLSRGRYDGATVPTHGVRAANRRKEQ
jgi:hypothetical protein